MKTAIYRKLQIPLNFFGTISTTLVMCSIICMNKSDFYLNYIYVFSRMGT